MNKTSHLTTVKPTIETTTRKKPSSKVKQARKEFFPRKKVDALMGAVANPNDKRGSLDCNRPSSLSGYECNHRHTVRPSQGRRLN